MADPKTKDDAPAAPAVPVAPVVPAEQADFPLSLNEFCSRLSASDRRVELISAFARNEKTAGRVKALQADYQTRFAAFIKTSA